MRIILAIVTLAAVGWTGWWFLIAAAKERAIEAWLAARREVGWVAEASVVSVGGFPYRIDTTLTGLELSNPQGGWSWTAPDFRLLTLAYQPNHMIAVWPREQTFASLVGRVRVLSEDMRGSVIVEPNLQFGLRRSTIDLTGLRIVGETMPWEVSLAHGILALRQAEGDSPPPNAYDVAFTAETLTLPKEWLAFDGAGVLDQAIQLASVQATATLDRPLDRLAVEGTPPLIRRLAVDDMTFTWGRLDLRGKGELKADAEGFAEGTIDLRARNWREMVEVAETSGAINSNLAAALRGGLGLIARFGGDPNVIEAPLEFSSGFMRLGPIPVGPAPRFGLP